MDGWVDRQPRFALALSVGSASYCPCPGRGPSWGNLGFSPLKWVAGAPRWPMPHPTSLGFSSLAPPLPHPQAKQPQAEPETQPFSKGSHKRRYREGRSLKENNPGGFQEEAAPGWAQDGRDWPEGEKAVAFPRARP